MKLFGSRLPKYILVSIIWLFSLLNIQAGEPVNNPSAGKSVKILTVGNSFANNAITYLPQITSSVPGCEIRITPANIGGCSLEKHAGLIGECEINPSLKPYSGKYCLKDLLLMDNYDFITIQQVSTSSFKPDSYYPHADILFKFLKKHAPHSQIIIHQTWAYSPSSQRLAEWKLSREEMHAGLVKSYNKLAGHLKVDILPSGNAFYHSWKKRPDIDLWAKDGYHASNNGCYLAGCVWFGKFFEVSPKKVKFVPDDMSPKTAKYLRKIAAKEIRKK
jgi:hypothetical protein